MNFERWEPIYEAIRADFGYDRADDERARDELADLVEPFDLDRLYVEGGTVAIAGAAPALRDELDRVRDADAVFAASNAADLLLRRGIDIDCMVTDLDKAPGTATDLTHAGTPVAVHAHGDNIPMLETHVPTFEASALLPTTQAAPTAGVFNPGGFTDGDRAAFLADHCGAAELTFLGWDFDDTSVAPMKQRKLRWAERLLLWLERRRDEQFTVLEGRRGSIDDSVLPV